MVWAALAGGAATGLVSGLLGNRSKPQTTTVNPWAPAAAAMKPAMDRLQGLTFNPDGSVNMAGYTGPDESTLGGVEMLRRAGADSSATDFYRQQLAGGTNPYLDATFDKASGKVRAALDSQFAQAGRYGSIDQQRLMGEQYGDLANQIYGGQYNQDMDNRFAAAGSLPGAMTDQAKTMLLAGQGASGIASADYDEEMKRLANYYGLTQPLMGTGSATTTPMYSNSGGAIAGGLLQLAGSYFGRPQTPQTPQTPDIGTTSANYYGTPGAYV